MSSTNGTHDEERRATCVALFRLHQHEKAKRVRTAKGGLLCTIVSACRQPMRKIPMMMVCTLTMIQSSRALQQCS